MDYGIYPGHLELRARGGKRVLAARFPLGVTATVRSSGRTRKERFASGSMSWQVREFEKVQRQLDETLKATIDQARKKQLVEQLEDALEKRNTFLLVGHDYNRTIADMRTGTLTVTHTRDAVELEAELPPENRQTSWVRDAVLGVEAGQLRGISPGFQVGDKGAERLVPEDGEGDSMVREILDSVVFEYSIVSRPAYATTSVAARADDPVPKKRVMIWL